MQPYKQIGIYRGSFTRFQPGMIISLYYCFMLHHNMFVFQIVLTILHYIKHQLCSLYVYSSFVYPVSCYSLIYLMYLCFSLLLFVYLSISIYWPPGHRIRTADSQVSRWEFETGDVSRFTQMVFMCLFGVNNFAGTLQREIHISHQTGKGKSSTLGNRYVPRRVVCSWSSVAPFSSHSLTVDSQTAGMLESPKIISLLLVSPSILHFYNFLHVQSSEWSPSHITTCSSTRWFQILCLFRKQLL